jgi:hypothetical protein
MASYQTQQPSTAPLPYYPQTTYDDAFPTFVPAGSNPYDGFTTYTADDASTQDYNESGSGDGQRYPD